MSDHRVDARGGLQVAEITMPRHTEGWVVVGRGPRERDRVAVSEATAALHGASLATLAIDLPARARAAEASVRAAAQSLRREIAGELPIAYLGAGAGARAGWAASRGGELDGVMALNAARGGWSKVRRVHVPSLLVVEHGSHDFAWRLVVARVLSWQLDAAELKVSGAPLEPGLLAGWYYERILSPAPMLPMPARFGAGRARRRVATIGAAAALVVPTALPAASAMALPDFSHGSKVKAHNIHGDGKRHHRHHLKARDGHRGGLRHARRVEAARILGDGFVSPFATGSQALIDNQGVKYFINTNITFSTSSSASGAMSEASYTHAVAATTLNGGTVQSTLNDAYDGYNTACISVNNTVATCETGNANFEIYNKNGPATTDPACGSPSRQIDFPTKTIGNLQMSRKVYVPSNDSFARWQNIVKNNGASPQTVTIVIANNLGSDSNTVITGSSSTGTGTPSTADTWVTTFQNYSGTTSSDPRLGHVLQGTGAATPLAGINFANGDDNPFWGYTFTLAPGQTKIVMNFAVVQPSKAAAAAKSAQLASLSDPNELNCMSSTDQSQVVNFATVLSQLQNLRSDVQSLPPTIGRLILVKGVNDMIANYQAGRTQSVCSELSFFKLTVEGWSGSLITTAQANKLLADADQISTSIGCP